MNRKIKKLEMANQEAELQLKETQIEELELRLQKIQLQKEVAEEEQKFVRHQVRRIVRLTEAYHDLANRTKMLKDAGYAPEKIMELEMDLKEVSKIIEELLNFDFGSFLKE